MSTPACVPCLPVYGFRLCALTAGAGGPDRWNWRGTVWQL